MSSPIEIINSTNYIISGEISYMTVFCSSHYFFVKPNTNWESEKRGICPIVQVSAMIRTPRGVFTAKPFVSIGTAYSSFEVIQTRENVFCVIRSRNTTNEKSVILASSDQIFLKQK
ncbi:hypothetical protein J2X97_002974 [Epilithonimonas hungarica]|uniref:hypothetical protein n=1 Tax=Epilithonimonas hungarica TaxID=454006 RepID=UPI0027817E46|nr:hypothetical protein [Epilithonimonas hungarica]MDP9957305.1 hypothetical protein [Epilithonimonas hungarica]